MATSQPFLELLNAVHEALFKAVMAPPGTAAGPLLGVQGTLSNLGKALEAQDKRIADLEHQVVVLKQRS